MTEQEWLECTDPTTMLQFLFGPFAMLTDDVCGCRKNVLLACACFSRLGEQLPPMARTWCQHAEQTAEGCYDSQILFGDEGEMTDWELICAIEHAAEDAKGRIRALADLWCWNDNPTCAHDGSQSFWDAERKEQASIIREIYGNPFRPVVIEPTWRTPKVVSIGKAIYDDRAFDRMQELAYALEEAGCTVANILAHCRGPGPHVRGCWVVDLLLGKE